ncbi:MAG TPA: orotidine 5'-phosphate decarboxylase [Nitrososphaeria archaeon]|nr:orotidine 5'-phosphate decarboxylase [Nitrososphaeria archaeon]
MDSSFRGRAPAKLWRLAEEKRSRLILALDSLGDNSSSTAREDYLRKCLTLLEALKDLAVGVKIGLPLTLKIGFEGVAEILESFKQDFYMIADFKLSDIPEIIQLTLNELRRIGFDAAITHLFQGGVPSIKRSLDLFGVVAMSHPSAKLIEENFENLVREAVEAGVDGVVVGATKPDLLKRARSLLPDKTILSPGVVAQGAEPASALRSGGDFEIVGRALTRSPEPASSARRILEAERSVVYR